VARQETGVYPNDPNRPYDQGQPPTSGGPGGGGGPGDALGQGGVPEQGVPGPGGVGGPPPGPYPPYQHPTPQPPPYQPAPPPYQQPPGYPTSGAPGYDPAGGYGQPAVPGGYPPGGYPPGGLPPTPKKSNTGLIIGIVVAVLAVLLCGGFCVGGVFLAGSSTDEASDSATPAGDALGKVIDYRTSNPSALGRDHNLGRITYPMTPPAGGQHNAAWQNCTGDVYTAQIANEHAVHSLEHGAVWITYRPDLPPDQVDELARKVRGRDYMMLSPFPGQPSPVSLQAWGYQLRVDSPRDPGVDAFIAKYRQTATMEPGATCGSGVLTTGTEPRGIN
jgi:hypothetical protein